MRAGDHFYSELDSIARRYRGFTAQAGEDASRLFIRLVAPIVGGAVGGELFQHWQERYGGEAANYEKLGHIAAFVLGEYDEERMDLDAEDWAALRDAISDAAEELDLDVLNRLMVELVSRGALD